MIIVDLFLVVAVTARNQHSLVWQVNLVHVTHQYLDLMEQLPKGIYDVCDLEIARCDFVKHRREQEKVIVANQTDLRQTIYREQFLKLHRSINSAEAAAENNYSFLARFAWYPSDH